MKYIPNMLTFSRMVLSVLLLFTINQSWLFVFVFLLCGLTDILDGYLARRMKLESNFGAKLDSAADLLMFGITLACILFTAGKELAGFYTFLAVIISIRFLNLIVAGVKYHCFLILHTWGNKFTGLLIYATICLYMIMKWNGIIYTVLMAATLTAVEELLIHMTSKTPNPNRKGLFWK